MVPDQPPKPEDSPENPEEARQKRMRAFGLLAVITTDLIGYTGAGVAIGYVAWAKLGWPWWVLMVTSMAGLVLAFYRLYQVSKKDWG